MREVIDEFKTQISLLSQTMVQAADAVACDADSPIVQDVLGNHFLPQLREVRMELAALEKSMEMLSTEIVASRIRILTKREEEERKRREANLN